MDAITLYRHPLSGNSHRVEALLSFLGLETHLVDVDLMAGEQRQPEFLALNPNGQVPVLVDGDVVLTESNAILVYLATKYDVNRNWLPTQPEAAAKVQQYLSLTANEIQNGPAAARLVTLFGAGLDHQAVINAAHKTLGFINAQLRHHDWLAGQEPTLADIAVYAYVAHAPEGNVSLDAYPKILAWLTRFESLKGFVPMQSSAVGLAA
ncbi:MAG: glutathione S-transferase [Gammaproteobacteria bacterium]|nr:MAG: glutathione S-transferase [Gammaproteobacteria bacterium]